MLITSMIMIVIIITTTIMFSSIVVITVTITMTIIITAGQSRGRSSRGARHTAAASVRWTNELSPCVLLIN